MGDLKDKVEADAAAQHEIDELRKTADRLARQLAKAKAKTELLVDAVHQAASDALVIAGKAKVAPPKKDRRVANAETALPHATDWQGGKRNETFNLDVLHARALSFAKKVDRLTEIQRADHPVPECVLLLGGDMVEGVNIFPGQAWEVDATLYEQLFRVARIVEEVVVSLLGTFERVRVFDMYGNHGRLGRKGEYPRHDNIDAMLYRIVAERFDDPRLEWTHAESWHQIVGIGAYKALLIHGDQIKSFGGNLPAYGILRKVNAWAAGVLPDFTDAYVGHFHTPQVLNAADGRKVYMTGSPESGNEFAREFVAATGTPSQTLNFVDPERGRVTAHYCVHLD